jgi:hypothetical protein
MVPSASLATAATCSTIGATTLVTPLELVGSVSPIVGGRFDCKVTLSNTDRETVSGDPLLTARPT